MWIHFRICKLKHDIYKNEMTHKVSFKISAPDAYLHKIGKPLHKIRVKTKREYHLSVARLNLHFPIINPTQAGREGREGGRRGGGGGVGTAFF